MKRIAGALVLVMAASGAAQDTTRREIESKLASVRVSLDFQDAPLDAVVDYLREISDMNIFIDTKVRDLEIKVSLKVQDLTLGSVLSLILRPHECDTMYRDGVLMVLTEGEVEDFTIKLQIYDCRDILHPIRDYPGVDIDVNQDGMGAAFQDLGGEEAPPIPIEDLVRAHTGGDSWDRNPKVAVRLENGLLIVKNTPQVHRQIKRLLNLLRGNK